MIYDNRLLQFIIKKVYVFIDSISTLLPVYMGESRKESCLINVIKNVQISNEEYTFGNNYNVYLCMVLCR